MRAVDWRGRVGAQEGCFEPLRATSKGRERLMRKPTARMTSATPRFAMQIEVWGSGRLRRLRVFELGDWMYRTSDRRAGYESGLLENRDSASRDPG